VTCPSTEELSALYDGRLKAKAARLLRDHLTRCPKCTQDLTTLSRMLKGIGSVPTPPSELVSRGQRLSKQPASAPSLPQRVHLPRNPSRRRSRET